MANISIPSSEQIIHGKPRRLWVTDAARALVMSMDLELRWLLVHVGGRDEFIRVARPYLDIFAGFQFTTEEMRWMFEVVKLNIPEKLPFRIRRLSIDEIEKPDTSPLDPDRDIDTETSPYKREVA